MEVMDPPDFSGMVDRVNSCALTTVAAWGLTKFAKNIVAKHIGVTRNIMIGLGVDRFKDAGRNSRIEDAWLENLENLVRVEPNAAICEDSAFVNASFGPPANQVEWALSPHTPRALGGAKSPTYVQYALF